MIEILNEPIILDPWYTGLPKGTALNPFQAKAYLYRDTYQPVVAKSPTGSGKSTLIHLYGAKHLEAGKSIMYVGIMKALADEKREDWSEKGHPWEELPKVSITGDFKYTAKLQKEIDDARLIVTTPESLMSRLRHAGSDKSAFLNNVGLVVWDEVHLVGAEGRGANYEAAIMEFAALYPQAQHLALSGTVPNAAEFVDWFSVLTQRDAILVESDYRPVPIEYHFLPYDSGSSASYSERARLDMVVEAVLDKPDEQFLVAVWKKAFGYKILQQLESMGIPAAFHNANAGYTSRKDIESAFKRKGVRVLISTSTLFTGVNLPARNVIITAVEIAKRLIPVFELLQAAGRAGRPRYDPKGDVYFFLPERRFDLHKNRIQRGERIMSQIYSAATEEVDNLATHFLGAIYMGRVADEASFKQWFKRTLSYLQFQHSEEDVDNLLRKVTDDMMRRGMVTRAGVGNLKLTARGRITAQLMLDPYHFYDIVKNLNRYTSLMSPNDIDLAKALGEAHDFRVDFMSRDEEAKVPQIIKDSCGKAYWKSCATIYYRITGQKVPAEFANTNFQIWNDLDRIGEGVMRAHHESERWEGVTDERLRLMLTRVKKSCSLPKAKMYLDTFYKGEGERLMKLGIYSLDDARDNIELAREVLKPERMAALGLVK